MVAQQESAVSLCMVIDRGFSAVLLNHSNHATRHIESIPVYSGVGSVVCAHVCVYVCVVRVCV